LHVQLFCTLLPAGDRVFAGQGVHSRSPGAEYLPAPHCWQFALVSEVLVGENVPAPHGEHSSRPTLVL